MICFYWWERKKETSTWKTSIVYLLSIQLGVEWDEKPGYVPFGVQDDFPTNWAILAKAIRMFLFFFSVLQGFDIKCLGIANLFHISLSLEFQEGFPVLCLPFPLSSLFLHKFFWAVISSNYEDIWYFQREDFLIEKNILETGNHF